MMVCGARSTAQVGGVIGKAGAIVKQIREETGARIRVVEGVPNCDERVIVVSSRNDPASHSNSAQARLWLSPTPKWHLHTDSQVLPMASIVPHPACHGTKMAVSTSVPFNMPRAHSLHAGP